MRGYRDDGVETEMMCMETEMLCVETEMMAWRQR